MKIARREKGTPAAFGKESWNMLTLTLTEGEYMTIGDNIVVQISRTGENRCKLNVQAPREIPIVRGEVLERSGEERPDCVFDAPGHARPKITWNRSKAQTLAAMRKLLSQMDDWDSNVQTLRRQLNHMFPPTQTTEVSNG